MMGECHLAASVSESRCCACWLTVLNRIVPFLLWQVKVPAVKRAYNLWDASTHWGIHVTSGSPLFYDKIKSQIVLCIKSYSFIQLLSLILQEETLIPASPAARQDPWNLSSIVDQFYCFRALESCFQRVLNLLQLPCLFFLPGENVNNCTIRKTVV